MLEIGTRFGRDGPIARLLQATPRIEAKMSGFHIEGDLTVPGDKSLTHRALMFAAAARGESRLLGALTGEDCQSTASVLRALGTTISPLAPGEEVVVRSSGIERWTAPLTELDCGNSGTTARLLLGLLAGRPFCSTLTGDESLRSRPMRRVTEPLGRMGAEVTELGAPDRLPLRICGGPLLPIDHRSPKGSAQIKSAILLAGLSGRVDVSVWEPIRSRDHTERMLRALGIDLEEGAAEDGWYVRSRGSERELPPLDMEIPGDPSSAAFLAALAALAGSGELRIRGVGVNPTRTGFFTALERMGGRVRVEAIRDSGGEPIADLVVEPSRLRGITVEPGEVPAMIDELPILACLAARAEGETRITGAEELRAKESDRIATLVTNLRAVGVRAEELPDGLVVEGTAAPLAGPVRAHHDHRIAMAFGVLGSLPENQIAVDTPEVVEVSFPAFWRVLEELTGGAAALQR